MLKAAVDLSPDREALVCHDDRLNYREYLSCVAGFAHELVEAGARNERVALVLGNSVDICIAMFAAHAAGAQAVPINPLYTRREISQILEDADPKVVIYDADKAGIVEPIAKEFGISYQLCIGDGHRRLNKWIGVEELTLPEPLPDPDNLATLQYTGGTTGLPKGVNLTHRAIATNISQREAILPTRPDAERILCIMPLFHCYAVAMCLHNMVYCRGTLVILPKYHPDFVFDEILAEDITIFAGSPTIFTGLMNHERFEQVDFSRIHVTYSGSAALPEDLLRRWEEATGSPVIEGYGQSESGPVLTFNPLEGIRKPRSVGIPIPETDLEIVDLINGTECQPVAVEGEVRVRGPQIMCGYRNLPDESAHTLKNGWLYTSDIGRLDEDGYLYLCDRKKEMVIVSGFNVYPREIEEVLHAHDDIREAAVIGVPDAYRGEIIVAYVVAKDNQIISTEELTEYCANNLAEYKIPAKIEFFMELPKTAVGKIDKEQLRKEAQKGQVQ
jgi:long-chain acyl-CoA synthetase